MKANAVPEDFGNEDLPGNGDKDVTAKKPAAKKKIRNVRNPLESEAFFGKQFISSKDLPNPNDSLKLLATGVVEVIAGTRQADQLSRFLTDGVYQSLQIKARQAREYREENGIKAQHQKFAVGSMRTESPRDGVIESVVMLNGQRRNRAVVIRLEGINHRWRATSLSVL
ncbi:MAG: hypothetical protein RIS82_67 [Actinomycetota bacterium]|jgi:hypothetical protein